MSTHIDELEIDDTMNLELISLFNSRFLHFKMA